MACELCNETGGDLLWRNEHYRIVHVSEPGYPGYCRVIWNAHVKEMTDLSETERARCLQGVFAVEAALRRLLDPEKVNLACLGNMTPHVHWHVIPRFKDDPHFPAPIWAAPQRPPTRMASPELLAALGHALRAALPS